MNPRRRSLAVGIGFLGLQIVFVGIVLLTGIHWAWSLVFGGVFVAMFGFGALDVDDTTSGR